MRWAAIGAGCLVACVQPASWPTWRDAGSAIAFPHEPDVRRVREGPWAMATVASARHGGASYEFARFVLPKAPSRADRARLIAEVERGITSRADIVAIDRADTELANRPARRLELSFSDGRALVMLVLFENPTTLVEVSVNAPAARIAQNARRFFRGYGSGAEDG
jgi:hypothetical protein